MKLPERVSELYTQVGQVDAAPTVAQQTCGTHERRVERSDGRVGTAEGVAVPELNHKLSDEHLPALDLNKRPETMPESGDED